MASGQARKSYVVLIEILTTIVLFIPITNIYTTDYGTLPSVAQRLDCQLRKPFGREMNA